MTLFPHRPFVNATSEQMSRNRDDSEYNILLRCFFFGLRMAGVYTCEGKRRTALINWRANRPLGHNWVN